MVEHAATCMYLPELDVIEAVIAGYDEIERAPGAHLRCRQTSLAARGQGMGKTSTKQIINLRLLLGTMASTLTTCSLGMKVKGLKKSSPSGRGNSVPSALFL